MPASDAQITAMEAALYSGVLVVEHDGHKIQYRSIDELRKALSDARNSQLGGQSKRKRIVRLYTGKDTNS